MENNNHVNFLTEHSAWVFTKQDTRFDEAFKATKLFADVCENPNINVEQYFLEHHQDYGIETDRHRMLVIAQQFGLITKTPFYTRGVQYHKERPTEIFDLIAREPIGSSLYNQIKTEQLLKIKIHSIIDTAGNNEDYYILPVIFIYQVLKTLQIKYRIHSISKGQFFTYVITCKRYQDLLPAVERIAGNGVITPFAKIYEDRSRILSIIKNNIDLFIIAADSISINPKFDDYFYQNFICKHNIEELHEQLLRDIDYSYLLYNFQHFDIDLCNPLEQHAGNIQTAPKRDIQEGVVIPPVSYLDRVDAIRERNINEDIARGAHKVPPLMGTSHHKELARNPILGKIAIKHAYYACENDYRHETFESNRTHKPYMEAHHLIPVSYQQEIWDKFHVNIDCLENLVSLCPTCHKAFHFGTPRVRALMIEKLFRACAPKYKSINFQITVEDIKKFYGIGDSGQ